MKIALGVTGCIAAYKAVELMRGLRDHSVSVQVILTRSARRFVGPLTFESLSADRVITSMFRPGDNREIQHIRLAQEIQMLAVVPATANILGKFAHGIADDFLSTFYLSCPAPVLLAPAMNVEMWHHPAVQANVAVLQSRGHQIIFPESGPLACGMEGQGRLAAVDGILAAILAALHNNGLWKGLKVLVTAGPTIEDIDPVRYISNPSSGKMGYALAQAAIWRGAEVHLVSGPTTLKPPAGAKVTAVRSAAEMLGAVTDLFPAMDVVLMAAAVSDYRPRSFSRAKLKKDRRQTALQLVPTEDILALLGRQKGRQVVIGFAAETDDLLANARKKLAAKNLDAIVANDVSQGVFGRDSASVHILSARGESLHIARESKLSIAGKVLDIADKIRLSRQGQRDGSADKAEP